MLNFTYTKNNGDISERYTLLVSEPNKNYLMFDLSDLTEEEKVEAEEIWKQYCKMRDTLFAETGLSKYYKNFKPECISNMKVV